MKGFAMLLKGLYPRLDWSTPQATLESLGVPYSPQQLIAEYQILTAAIQAYAERQARIEAMLMKLTEAIESGRTNGNRNTADGAGNAAAAGSANGNHKQLTGGHN